MIFSKFLLTLQLFRVSKYLAHLCFQWFAETFSIFVYNELHSIQYYINTLIDYVFYIQIEKYYFKILT